MPSSPVQFTLRNAEIKFTSTAASTRFNSENVDNVDLNVVFDDHPDRKLIVELIQKLVASETEPRVDWNEFVKVHWSHPIRMARPTEKRLAHVIDYDMRDYLTTRLSRSNCPMDIRGDMSEIVPAHDRLFPGMKVDLNLRFNGYWIQPPPVRKLPEKIYVVSAYVLGVRNAGGVPLRLRPLL